MSEINIVSYSDSFSNMLNQAIYITSENESVFFIKNIEDPLNPNVKLDKLLFIASVLKRGGYISNTEESFKISRNNKFYESIFYYELSRNFIVRNNSAFQGCWDRSKSGHWSYIVK
ncbi:MAG: hypothetical protein ACOCV1_02420 [Bacillota bacterium]